MPETLRHSTSPPPTARARFPRLGPGPLSASPPSTSPLAPGLLPTALLAAALLAAASTPAGAEIGWRRITQAACAPEDAIACGPAGFYDFFSPLTTPPIPPGCGSSIEAGGREEPPDLVGGFPGHDLPCDQGSCFVRPTSSGDGGGEHRRRPHVAVIDWDDPHGWSVGGVLDALAPRRARLVLFAFEESRIPAELAPDVGDAHLLERLCAVAEMPPSWRPDVLNMSFGRPIGPDEPKSCDEALPGFEPSLKCEIERLLGLLRHDQGVEIVAAAGHHGRLLFPASSASVRAAGALEPSVLDPSASVTAAPITPPSADVLMPGYGLFLGTSGSMGAGGPGLWPVPPGSSYASAFTASWLTRALHRSDEARDWLAERTHARLMPRLGDNGRWTLGAELAPDLGLERVPGSRSKKHHRAMEIVAGHALHRCANTEPLELRRLELAGPAVELGGTSLDDLRTEILSPSPESFPCVPCHDMPDGSPNLDVDFGPRAPVRSGTRDLRLDLSRSTGFDTEKYELLGVFLRVGRDTLELTDSRHRHLLDDLASGRVEGLEILAVPTRIQSEPVALVFEVAHRGGSQRTFTQAVPVVVHGH